LPTNQEEWPEELERVTEKTKELLAGSPDLLISVYTLLNRIKHFHRGEDCVLNWYRRLDHRIRELISGEGFFENKSNKLIVISNHGFCSFGEVEIWTLPHGTEQGKPLRECRTHNRQY
jgi:hypothetical protein